MFPLPSVAKNTTATLDTPAAMIVQATGDCVIVTAVQDDVSSVAVV